MTAPDLPAELKTALDGKLQGLSRTEAAERARRISQTYREGGGSGAIRTPTDALAYALARMPATYAAVAACLHALQEVSPDFAPASLLDVGAGPGTATWAAVEAFPSLQSLTLLDENHALREMALDLSRDSFRLRGMQYRHGEAGTALADGEAADLVLASYMIGEIDDTKRTALVARLWSRTRDTLLIVEPGTPAGYARMIAARAQLIAAGAHVAAPCPHDQPCPLQPPDWCHFSQRLPRSRAHKQLKSAELPYEDEKFSYLAVTRAPVARRPKRVLARPVVTKIAVEAKLCTEGGISNLAVPRRDKAAYSRYRKCRWGDAIFGDDAGAAE